MFPTKSLERQLSAALTLDLADLVEAFDRRFGSDTLSLTELRAFATEHGLSPLELAFVAQACADRHKNGWVSTAPAILEREVLALVDVSLRAVEVGRKQPRKLKVLTRSWTPRLAGSRLLGAAGKAHIDAIAIQEFCAGGGLVRADPTCGATGAIPGAQSALREASGVDLDLLAASSLVAGLVGCVAFSRGPVSGAQSGCAGEVGVAVAEAAAEAAWLFDGRWDDIDAAVAFGAGAYVGLECSPTGGFVEMPCVPRNGFGAQWAILSGELAIAGHRPEFSADEALDAIFGIGALLPASLRETESGVWAAQWLAPREGEGLRGRRLKHDSLESCLDQLESSAEMRRGDASSSSLLGAAGRSAHQAFRSILSGSEGSESAVSAAVEALSSELGAGPEQQRRARAAAELIEAVVRERGTTRAPNPGWGHGAGVVAAQAAAAASMLLGGGWDELDAAAALATTSFVTVDAGSVLSGAPFRFAFAALAGVTAAVMARDGIRGEALPHDFDDCLDRLLGVARSVEVVDSGPFSV